MMWRKVSFSHFDGKVQCRLHGHVGETFTCAHAAIVGDITPNCGVSKEEKARLESEAIADIQMMLGPGTIAGTSVLACSMHVCITHGWHVEDTHAVCITCRAADKGAF